MLQQVEDDEKLIALYQERVQVAEKERADLEAALLAKTGEAESLQAQIATYTLMISGYRTLVDDLKREVADAKNEIARLNEKVADLRRGATTKLVVVGAVAFALAALIFGRGGNP